MEALIPFEVQMQEAIVLAQYGGPLYVSRLIDNQGNSGDLLSKYDFIYSL